MKIEHVIVIVGFVMLGFAGLVAPRIYHQGFIRGACVEMCRPAQFDSDQEVNGGCLCIGSDKVLRFKNPP